jgi:hypothetical protein
MAFADEPGEAVSEHRGFAGAGAGHYQHGAGNVLYGLTLAGV